MKRIVKHKRHETTLPAVQSRTLLVDVREMILATRERVAQTVNAGLTLLYWQIGTRIRKDILLEKRAGYGEEIVQTLSAKLEMEFGRGFRAQKPLPDGAFW